jgi:hypothetical protein
MSWQDAKTTAERIYSELRAKHDHGFVGMVIDALRRQHARDRTGKNEATPNKAKNEQPKP